MLSAKTKGLFIEQGYFGTRAAVTNSLQAPLQVERLVEFPADTPPERLRTFVTSVTTGKTAVRYVPAAIGIYPDSRFFRRHSMEVGTKIKEAAYFQDLLENQFKIDAQKNMVAVVNASDGSSFDLTKGASSQKEVLLCGALQSEISSDQETLVELGIYPERLELGSLSTIGALMSYIRYAKISKPVLFVEIGAQRSHLYILTSERLDLCRPIPHGLESMFPIIQKELGLKDEESARKLLYSNTFDFTETAPTLLRKLLKELQASIGFYEVQTGQTVGDIFVHLLPENLTWIRNALSRSLGIKLLQLDYSSWLKAYGITASEGVNLGTLDQCWAGLLSLLPNYSAGIPDSTTHGKEEE